MKNVFLSAIEYAADGKFYTRGDCLSAVHRPNAGNNLIESGRRGFVPKFKSQSNRVPEFQRDRGIQSVISIFLFEHSRGVGIDGRLARRIGLSACTPNSSKPTLMVASVIRKSHGNKHLQFFTNYPIFGATFPFYLSVKTLFGLLRTFKKREKKNESNRSSRSRVMRLPANSNSFLFIKIIQAAD